MLMCVRASPARHNKMLLRIPVELLEGILAEVATDPARASAVADVRACIAANRALRELAAVHATDRLVVSDDEALRRFPKHGIIRRVRVEGLDAVGCVASLSSAPPSRMRHVTCVELANPLLIDGRRERAATFDALADALSECAAAIELVVHACQSPSDFVVDMLTHHRRVPVAVLRLLHLYEAGAAAAAAAATMRVSDDAFRIAALADGLTHLIMPGVTVDAYQLRLLAAKPLEVLQVRNVLHDECADDGAAFSAPWKMLAMTHIDLATVATTAPSGVPLVHTPNGEAGAERLTVFLGRRNQTPPRHAAALCDTVRRLCDALVPSEVTQVEIDGGRQDDGGGGDEDVAAVLRAVEPLVRKLGGGLSLTRVRITASVAAAVCACTGVGALRITDCRMGDAQGAGAQGAGAAIDALCGAAGAAGATAFTHLFVDDVDMTNVVAIATCIRRDALSLVFCHEAHENAEYDAALAIAEEARRAKGLPALNTWCRLL